MQKLAILLVEDNALISLDAEDMLMAMGARHVHVVHTLAAARQVLDSSAVEAVVLDLLIGQERSESLAEELVARKMPVVFASGLANTIQLPSGIRHLPVVAKPYTSGSLAVAFRQIGLGDE